MTSILRLARRLRSDQGIALPVVMGLGLAMLLLIAGAMSVATSGLKKTNTDEDWNAALAAAYAGVEEYQSRLANDATYTKYGDKDAAFSTGSNLTLPTGANANPAFGRTAGGTWASIPTGSASIPVTSYFRYEVDNRDYSTKGILHLRSTGKVGTVTRTIVADLKQDGFIDYLYFTNYETQDPAYSGGIDQNGDGVADTDATGKNVCENYNYGANARPSACGNIQFGKNDNFSGPVRSNDLMQICGSTFQGPVTTSSTTNPLYATPSGCNAPVFKITGSPQSQGTIDMPPTNAELKKETRTDLPSEVARPGCLYTGPTTVSFEISGGKGMMRVISPWTRFTQITATSGSNNTTLCGEVGTSAGQLGSTGGALVPILDLNLLYVQAVPAVGSGDPNAPANSNLPLNFSCTAAGKYANNATSSNSNYPAGWALSTSTVKNGVTTTTYFAKYPAVDEIVPGGSSSLVHYGCRAGDVYVKGTVKGQTTVAAENYIYVTDDLLYNDPAADMVGLVGSNAVFVWNPMRGTSNSNWTPILTDTDREIDAAILSVGHTFQVQNYDRGGARGTLTVLGAIAQKFRGTVATTSNNVVSNGYVKAYKYDARYRSTAPPKFLTPVSTTYGVTQFAGVPAAFDATGAPL